MDLDKMLLDLQGRNHDTSESLFILKMMRSNSLTKVTDFGVFIGAVAVEIRKLKKIEEYAGIDAVDVYLEAAKKNANLTEVIHATIITPFLQEKRAFKDSFRVFPKHPIVSSTLFPSEDKIGPLDLPTGPEISPEEFVASHPHLFAHDRYVKSDIDGVDLPLIHSIIEAGYRPGAIQFEVWNEDFDAGISLQQVVAELEAAGYFIPPFDFTLPGFFMMSVSKKNAWICNFKIPRNSIRWFFWSRTNGLELSAI